MSSRWRRPHYWKASDPGRVQHRDGLDHVVFEFVQDDDGWPPVTAERVWARPVGGHDYELQNAPWFAFGVAEGDVVRALAPSRSMWPESPAFRHVVRYGGNCNIRVIAKMTDDPSADVRAVMALFLALGGTSEGMTSSDRLFAMTVPPTADLAAIKQLLIDGETDGRWFFEEGSVTEEWKQL